MPTEIAGAAQLIKALRKVEPTMAKEINKNMAWFLKPIVKKARGFVPSDSEVLSGWSKPLSSADTIKYRAFPKFNSSIAKRGIGYSATPSRPNREGFSYLAQIHNKSAAGAIYETAGRKNPMGQPPAPDYSHLGLSNYREDRKKYNKSLNKKAGKQFIDALPDLVDAKPRTGAGRISRKYKGRLIFKAWAEDQGKANSAILKAVEYSLNNVSYDMGKVVK